MSVTQWYNFKTLHFIVLSVFLFLSLAVSSFSQEAPWLKTGGPSGGLGYDVRIHPEDKNIMFVTDNPSGVNKSYDAGKTWTQRNKGITTRTGSSGDGIPVFSLTIDPNNPNIVWTGTQNAKGIYKSIDCGETWTKMDNGVMEDNEISFRGFGIDPNNSDIVFAGAEIETGVLGIEFTRVKGKIYRTENGGKNWCCVWKGGSLARFIIINPTVTEVNANGQVYSKIMYASTGIFDREAFNDNDNEPGGVGILKSTDGGKTWHQINDGITNRFVGFLAMHPTNPDVLFAATGNNAWAYPPNNLMGGVYRTQNGGDSWEQMLFGNIFTVVTFSLSNPNTIYAGSAGAFYRSDDGGETWRKFQQKKGGGYGPPGVRAGFPISAVVAPDDPMTIFANNYGGGNFKSNDGGQTWVDASKGYTGADLRDITIDANNPDIVYTIGRSGPFSSFNGGEDWAGIAFPPATAAEWYAIALNPDNQMEVIISDEHQGIIFRSVDSGNRWEKVFKHPEVWASNPNKRHGFKTIAYAPSNTEIIYAGMRRESRAAEGDLPYGPSFGIYKSTDGGNMWTEKNAGLEGSDKNINDIVVHPLNPDIAYAGTLRDGIYKTMDGGENWASMSNGLVSADIQCLALEPKNPEVVYAGLGEGCGIFKSVNSGELWQETNQGIDLQCPSSLLPVGKVKEGMSVETPNKLMFAGRDYYSIPWTSVKSIVIDPTNPKTIYAADYSSGVYMSVDGGVNWQMINDGLSTRSVSALVISANGKVLYAATSGEGVFRLSLTN